VVYKWKISFLSLICIPICANIGCSPIRPHGVPATAVFAGGLKGGVWTDCKIEKLQKNLECVVFNENGSAAEYGDYTAESYDSTWMGNFDWSRHMYKEKILVPILAYSANNARALVRIDDNLPLDQEIQRSFKSAFNDSPKFVTVNLPDVTGRIFYSAHFSDDTTVQQGEIWGQKIVEVQRRR
jgi:hypothetical protein